MRQGCIVCAAALLLLVPGGASAAPVLSTEVPPGTAVKTLLPNAVPSAKAVDGSAADWRGRLPRFGGAVLYSRGELLYQDHLFDAYGADGGDDAERLALLGPLQERVADTYRFEQLIKMDLGGQVGAPDLGLVEGSEHYGDLARADAADLLEARVATVGDTVWFLARTTTLTDAASTGVLVLVALLASGLRAYEARIRQRAVPAGPETRPDTFVEPEA